MCNRSGILVCWLILSVFASLDCIGPVSSASHPECPAQPTFRAGAATIDITPTTERSIVAGGFLEDQATKINDQLYVRCILLDDGATKIALTVVDTCMMTQLLIDEAKKLANQQTGIPVDKMMVCATHTHSAPAAMACLGTRQDKDYAQWLPAKIAEAIVAAHNQLAPARIGWNSVDDWQHSHNRRWIRKPENKIVDPFGQATGLAHMHPGYLSTEVIGPSGPVDPELSLISVQNLEGKPIAVLANYSQHYFGTQAISSDYYGLFCKHVAELLHEPGEGNGPFVCAMSQGTSGDLMWMDYGSPAKTVPMAEYAESVARYAEKALSTMSYRDHVPLAMSERTLWLNYRVPNEDRIEWARPIASTIENDLAKSIQEVYAKEALILHDRQSTELKLQAIQIGELTIAALPNEVYALTGLKLKGRSPSPWHFNIELANGAEGYIPPPEQHTLGGYTTWPARTAGLEVDAEPKIVDTLLDALEQTTQRKRRIMDDEHGAYANAILQASPISYWRLNDADGNIARNAITDGEPAQLAPGFAWYLPGVGSGTGIGLQEELTTSPFSGPNQINRAVHVAGGELKASFAPKDGDYSIVFWFWLGERSGASERNGTLCVSPYGDTLIAKQSIDHQVRLELNGVATDMEWPADDWHQVSIVHQKGNVAVYIDESAMPVAETRANSLESTQQVRLGKGLQGKLDELAVFDRALTSEEAKALHSASGQPVGTPKEPINPLEMPASKPLSPEKSLAKIHVPNGFRVELVASEPQVIDPVAFDWDAAGKLWLVEMSDYPMGMDGQGKPGGRVRVLEDQDGDGRYEHSTLFADGLNFPNGIITWRDGVIVSAAPQILFLSDSDGDGKADKREVLFEGFNEGNQQLRMNGLRWGLDNWIYCANGGHHADHGLGTKVLSHRNQQSYEIGSRDFRFQPDSGELMVESGPSQFGRNRDAWGHWFGTQNSKPLWNYVISDRYLARNPFVPSASPIQFVLPPNSPPVYPASRAEKRFHSFGESGHFTSACGGMIYGDQNLFDVNDKLHAFTCEPFHNLVQHNIVSDVGVSFTSKRPVDEGSYDFFASEDRWCRPVMARTGPDGALWIADMYRYMIEHPDWLPPEGKQELLPHYRLGDDRGRIYRIVSTRELPRKVQANGFSTDSIASIVNALDSANDWQRDKAQQLLVNINDKSAVPLLERLVRSSERAETRLQALATLDGLGSLEKPLVKLALHDPHPRVRENAIRMIESTTDLEIQTEALQLASDPDDKVCLQLALTVGEWSSIDAGRTLVKLAERYYGEPFVRSAVMSSALRHASVFAEGMSKSPPEVASAFRESIVRQSIGRKDYEALQVLLSNALTDVPSVGTGALDELLLTLQRVGSSLDELAESDETGALVAPMKRFELFLQQKVKEADLQSMDATRRIDAARLLCRTQEYRSFGIESLSQWLAPQIAPEMQHRVLETYSQCGDDRVIEVLARVWASLSPELRIRALDVWLSRTAWAGDLLDRIEQGLVKTGGLELEQRDRLLRYPDAAIAERSQRLLLESQSSTRKEIVDHYRQALELQSEVGRGKAVYVRVCANCHRRENDGHEVGPNLATVTNHTSEKLLINVLDPNADIQPGYQAYNVLLENGEVLSGLLAGETANSITIKLANGSTRTISRLEIEELRNSNMSFMPEGLEATLTQQDLSDLIAFLQSPVVNAKP